MPHSASMSSQLAASALAADWTEYRVGPLRVVSDAGDGDARKQLTEMEQLRFVLTEGKKRQIRRMCELVGLKVVGLKRIRIGRVVLGNLPVGRWRYLTPGETF